MGAKSPVWKKSSFFLLVAAKKNSPRPSLLAKLQPHDNLIRSSEMNKLDVCWLLLMKKSCPNQNRHFCKKTPPATCKSWFLKWNLFFPGGPPVSGEPGVRFRGFCTQALDIPFWRLPIHSWESGWEGKNWPSGTQLAFFATCDIISPGPGIDHFNLQNLKISFRCSKDFVHSKPSSKSSSFHWTNTTPQKKISQDAVTPWPCRTTLGSCPDALCLSDRHGFFSVHFGRGRHYVWVDILQDTESLGEQNRFISRELTYPL